MAVVTIKLKASAFSAGNPLAAMADYKERVKIVVGTHQYSEPVVGGAPLAGGRAAIVGSPEIPSRRAFVIDLSGWQMANVEQFNALPLEDFRTHLADLVARGIVEVAKDGVAQTAAAIASASGI